MDEEDKFQEDDDFFDVEARGRCYTWPVNQNTVNVGIVPTPRRGSNSSTCTPLSDSYYTLVSTSGSKYLSSDNSLSGHTSTGYEQNFLLSHDPGQFLTRCRQQPSPSYNPCLTVPSISSLSNFPSNIKSNSTLNEPSNNSSVSSSVDQLFQNKSYLDDNERESQNNSPILDYSEKPKRVRRRNIGDPTTHKKPNPWGDDSYSDLIARAISSSDTERLKLNEIYQWFIDNIPYFGEKSSQEDAQGWKNSIRHNLSLHSRFMRIQNEGAGKSSWWVINPDAKPGRNPRRRANTMENAVKSIDKKRRGVGSSSSRKSSLHGPFTSNETCAMDSGESLGLDSGIGGNSNFEVYRPRTQSALSIPGTSSRISPTQEPPGFEDFDFSNWMDRSQPQKCPSNSTNVKELLDRTDQMRIDAIPADIKLTSRIKAEPSSPQEFGQKIPLTNGGITLRTLKAECLDSNYAIAAASIKMENSGLQPPPSYQELTSSDFCNVQVQPNQINQLIQSQQNTNGNLSKLVTSSGQFYTPASTAYNDNISLASMQPLTAHSHSMIPGLLPAQWMINQAPNQEYQSLRQQINPNIPHQNQINQQSGFHRIDGLPQDLENLVSLDQPLAITLQSMDMEAVLRHELSHSHGNQLQFDLP